MNELFGIITNPLLYTSLIGVLVAFYTLWSLARQQYLGVDKLFNVLALSLGAGWFAGWVVQSLVNRIWESELAVNQLWVSPRPLVVLVGYIGVWLVATRYIRSIRYPYWRLMDMLFIGIAIIQSALLVGWAIDQPGWLTVIISIIAIIITVALFVFYRRVHRSGIIAGLQSATFFGLILFMHQVVPSWQKQAGGVEWVADGVGIVLAITLVILRVSAKSEAIMQDIPRGVSQSFHETFTRAFNKKSIDKKSDN